MKLAFAMPHQLEIGVITQPWELTVTGADQLRLVKLADELGYDMVATPEHFVIPDEHVGLSGDFYFHAASAQAFFAGATERIRVNSCVSLLPLQNPIITAKSLATLDWLSGGRAMVTFGVGWLKDEFDLLGVPFGERGAIADEYLAAIIELWTSDQPTFEGKYVSFSEVGFAPRPVQQPHPTVWIGGDADAPLRRAARFAQGWWPFLTPPAQIAERIDFIKSQPDFRGEPFDVMYGIGTSKLGEGHTPGDPSVRTDLSADEIVDELGRLAEWGVTYSAVPTGPVGSVSEFEDRCRWMMEEVRPQLT